MSIFRPCQGLGVVPGKCAGVEAGFEPRFDDREIGRDVEVPGYEQAVVADVKDLVCTLGAKRVRRRYRLDDRQDA
jgi:hypothetical protein